MKIYRLVLISIGLIWMLAACNKEEALKPSADFTTNIKNNTLAPGQDFTLYLNNAQGEFLTYFKGNTLINTYDANEPTRRGVSINTGLDSLVITGYPASLKNDTTFVFTLVASSSGNWAKDYLQDVKSITISIDVP
jgi:hypothetical protein